MLLTSHQSLSVSSSSSFHTVFFLSPSQKNPNSNFNSVRYPNKKQQHSKLTCFLNLGLDDAAQIAHNKVLIAAAASAAIGQLSKPFTSVLFYGGKFDLKSVSQAGGFPSTHSSSVVATATSLALERGFSDSIFGLSVVYAGLVMYDAQGVRREVGNHARALNKVVPNITTRINNIASRDRDDGFMDSQIETSSMGNLDSPSFSSTKSRNSQQLVITDERVKQSSSSSLAAAANQGESPLKESIGHTEVEVVAGAFLGFLVSLAVYAVL